MKKLLFLAFSVLIPLISTWSAEMKPSDVVKLESIESVLGWQASSIVVIPKTVLSKGRNTLCSYNYQDSYLSLQTIFSGEGAKTNKAVDRRFREWLENGEDGIEYKPVEGSNGDQIFGTKTGSGELNTFILRKKWGNDSHAKFELMTKSSESDVVQSQLQELMALL